MTLDVVGRIDECFLLSYAVDPARAAPLVPPELEIVTCRGCAFLNIVACHVDRIRPRGAPAMLGVSYWHVAYRLHVRAALASGASIDGLYFLRSDADSPLVGALGNLMTPFRFHRAAVRFHSAGDRWMLNVVSERGHGSATLRARRALSDDLQAGSPFSTIQEREAWLKYAPFGLSVSESREFLRVAEVRRDELSWKEGPVTVEAADWPYARALGFDTARLMRATRVAPIHYTWRIGRSELLCYRSGLPR